METDAALIRDLDLLIDGETWYRIENVDAMRPFVMSIVSASDHWLFLTSTGAVTAGRVSPDNALFPYDTEDKVADGREHTGGKTILRVRRDGVLHLWEPWSDRDRGRYRVQRSLSKHAYGDEVVFEERNLDLQLTCRIAWRTGDRFGLVRSVSLFNQGGDCAVTVLDGLQNLLPAGTSLGLQRGLSVLVDAYKRHELDQGSGLALYRLTAALTDTAKPCASLRANVAWQAGIEPVAVLLGAAQVDAFRAGGDVVGETDIRGRRGAYWVQGRFDLPAAGTRNWSLVADVALDHAQISDLIDLLARSDPAQRQRLLAEDVAANRQQLRRFAAAADGLQCTADRTATGHHFANTIFNIMRGGVFADGHRVQRDDVAAHIAGHNRDLAATWAGWISGLPEVMDMGHLRAATATTGDAALLRLVRQYLPLHFSRRHGDPTRPWNSFSIRLRNSDGSPRLDYQGNWRDIFQNWEALLHSHPAFIDNAICVFLNATSLDGYNPAAISRAGIEWHRPHPDRPTAKVGHAGDHQLIYLLRLLELRQRIEPGALAAGLDLPAFAYARIPYRFRTFPEILADPFDSIRFDHELDKLIGTTAARIGNDGRLLPGDAGGPRLASLLEKLLSLVLAKLANLVPGGGIWMNTQRPEWNDGNSALSGWGLSVVTLCYLHRFLACLRQLVEESSTGTFSLAADVGGLLQRMHTALSASRHLLQDAITDRDRLQLLRQLGTAHADFRQAYYAGGAPAGRVQLSRPALLAFLDEARAHCRHGIRLNRREDGLYHSYNLLVPGPDGAALKRLDEMLEGQVAALSSGCLDDQEALRVLRALRASRLFTAGRNSYLLAPERELPRFLDLNTLPSDARLRIPLLAALVEAGNRDLVVHDGRGNLHFAGGILNEDALRAQLDRLAAEPRFAPLVPRDAQAIADLFERMFDHRSFTGRSGTMYGYEGLGCIYWHMVAKLLVAIDERTGAAGDPAARVGFRAAYEDVRNGLGFTRGAARYGAFPTDPYSHTRSEGGARQPGMTGQVKEELLTRLSEMGVRLDHGRLAFDSPQLRDEALPAATTFSYIDALGEDQQLALQPGEQAFTLCQVPIVLHHGAAPAIHVTRRDGTIRGVEGLVLDQATTAALLARDGSITALRVFRQVH